MMAGGEWAAKLIGIIVLTLHDYLRYWLSRRPRTTRPPSTLQRMTAARRLSYHAARRRRQFMR